MPRYPAAVWRPLSENHRQPRGSKGLVIVHSAVARGSLFDYFERRDVGLESTFWVSRDGLVEQYLDSSVRADANRNANGRAISIETEDDGDPDRQPWAPRQLDALVALIGWCCATHDIPRVRATGPDGRGVGFHTMWGAPSAWTPVKKSCPGKARILQFERVVLPRIAFNDPEDDDLTPDESRMLREVHKVLVQNRVDRELGELPPGDDDLATPILAMNGRQGPIQNLLQRIAAKVGA